MRRVVAFGLAIVATVGGALLVAVPASAFTVAPDQRVDVVNSFDATYFVVDPATGDLTDVSPNLVFGTVSAVDVDDTGHGYAVTQAGQLWVVDANTGVFSGAIDVTLGGERVFACYGMDYSLGQITAACYTGQSGTTPHVGTIDPATGVFTALINPDTWYAFLGIARDPVTGVLWGLSSDENGNRAHILDLAAGTVTYQSTLTVNVGEADFDRDGRMIMTSLTIEIPLFPPVPVFTPRITVVDPLTGIADPTPATPLVAPDGVNLDEIVRSVTVWGAAPTPALPATGINAWPGIGLGIGLLLAGAVLALRRRRA